jgi:hypothetical protein
MRIWVFLYRLILFLFQSMIPSTLENPMTIPSYQISSWDHFDPMSYLSEQHLDQDHIHLDLTCIVPTYSNYKCVNWVKCDTFNLSFYLCYYGIDQIDIIVLNPIPFTQLGTLSLVFKYHLYISITYNHLLVSTQS